VCVGVVVGYVHGNCLVRACSHDSPACNAPPYWQMQPLSQHIFRRCFINDTIFRKKATEHKMCILIFSTALFKTFLILRSIQIEIVINVKKP
jgi:hypothetical protein